MRNRLRVGRKSGNHLKPGAGERCSGDPEQELPQVESLTPNPRPRTPKMTEPQGYLAHKNTPPPPEDYYVTLGIVLLQGPRGLQFLMSEEPLH